LHLLKGGEQLARKASKKNALGLYASALKRQQDNASKKDYPFSRRTFCKVNTLACKASKKNALGLVYASTLKRQQDKEFKVKQA
jgi:hypothetical protein